MTVKCGAVCVEHGTKEETDVDHWNFDISILFCNIVPILHDAIGC